MESKHKIQILKDMATVAITAEENLNPEYLFFYQYNSTVEAVSVFIHREIDYKVVDTYTVKMYETLDEAREGLDEMITEITDKYYKV